MLAVDVAQQVPGPFAVQKVFQLQAATGQHLLRYRMEQLHALGAAIAPAKVFRS